MKKLTRNLALAVILTTTCGAFAHADDIVTGTDPVPPTHPSSGGSSTATTVAAILAVLYGVVL